MNSAIDTLPDNVDIAQVRDFDIFKAEDPDGDYHSWWHDRFQTGDTPEIFWTNANGGHWVITRGVDVDHVLAHPELYSSSINGVPRERTFGFPLIPINLDPPEHPKYRALFINVFSPKNVKPLGDSARRLTIDLIDGFYRQGHCEFMADVSYHLPIAIFLNIVGVPDSERLKLLQIVEGVVRPTDPSDRQPFMALYGFAQEVLAERRAKPGNDLLSQLVIAEVEGKPLTDVQIIGAMLLLLIAGLDTVASSLGFIRARHALLEKIRGPSSMAQASVEELFRRFPVATIVRIVTEAHDYRGIRFEKGDLVSSYTGAHTLDDREFANPLELDFGRKASFHAGFGNGIHRCLGSVLARVEVKTFLEEWLPRIPDFEVDAGVQLHTRPGLVVVLVLEQLPLRWQAA